MISGIILASGFSNRMGQDKLLLKLGQTPIVEKVIHAAVESLLDEVILVYRRKMVKAIAAAYEVKTVFNSKAKTGQSASVIKGILASTPDTHGFLFMMGDQPFITAEAINHILACHVKAPKQIIVPTYNGKNGNPVFFPSVYKNELLKIRGDNGGRHIIRAAGAGVTHVQMKYPHHGYDIDTPEDFAKLEAH